MSLKRHLSLRAKLFIFLCVVSLLPLLLSSTVLTSLGGNSFRRLLRLQVRDGLDQTERSFQVMEKRLLSEVIAVAHWEELATFFLTRNQDWIKANLEAWAPQTYQLDYLALADENGNALYQWSPYGDTGDEILQALRQDSKSSNSGWISTPRDIFLLAESKLTKGNDTLGTLIFGRRLSHRLLLELNDNQEAELLVYYGGKLLATTDTTSAIPLTDPSEFFSGAASDDGTYVYETADKKHVIGFRSLENPQGMEIATVGWFASQLSAKFIQEAIRDLLFYFGIPLIALILVAAFALGLWIESPIRTLSNIMEKVRSTGDLTQQAPVSGGGEISTMSLTFNQMLQQLAKQHNELATFQTMIQAMKEGVLIEAPDHQIIYMNPRMEELLGVDGEDSCLDSLKLDEIITAKGQRIEDDKGFYTEEVEWIRQDGKRVQAIKTSGRLEDSGGGTNGILSTFVDITERNDLELELIEASRMAFLGLFSQGVLHNISGPTNSILGFSNLLCRDNANAEIPQRIHTDAKRIAEQVNILGRRWQRTGTRQKELLNLNEIIQDEVKFLEADMFYKHNVEKHFDLDPDLPGIRGSYGDFSHALLNVVINSIEALTESPIHRLTIRTSHTDSEIRLEIEDTGVGIPPEIQNKIFLPFFSTKRRNTKDGIPRGAGLGLAIARKVLEPYNVKFEINSEPGRGTCMILHIPIMSESPLISLQNYNAEEMA